MPRKRPYDQFCPIAQTLDVVGDRWTLLIARELFFAPVRYGELLEGLAPVSTDMLAKRLKEMEGRGLVMRSDGAYDLTADGRDLAPVLAALGGWSIARLMPPRSPDDIVASRIFQMLAISNHGNPLDEHCIEVRARDLVATLSSGANGIRARRGPANQPDSVITSDDQTLWDVSTGDLAWSDALSSGAIAVDGDTEVACALLAGQLPVTLARSSTNRVDPIDAAR